MSLMPWRKEKLRYAEVGDDDDQQDTAVRRYPYFPTQPASENYHSDSDNNSFSIFNLELESSDLTSPLGVGESTCGFFTADFPLVSPVQQECARPLRRTSSINRRRPRSSEATVRRRFSKDMMLQKTAILQSIKGKDSDEADRKSLEKSLCLRLGGVLGGGIRNEEDEDSKSIESRLGKVKLHDGNHRHHRSMTRIPKGTSLPRGREQRRRSRSERRSSIQISSRSSSDEKRALSRSIRSERRTKRRSESDVQELESRSSVVEGAGGIIRPNHDHRFKAMNLSKSSLCKIPPPPLSGAIVLRSQSHERVQAKLIGHEQDDELKKERIDQRPSSFNNRSKKRPSSFNKQEISDIYSQAHQRHLQRYSSGSHPTNGPDNED